MLRRPANPVRFLAVLLGWACLSGPAIATESGTEALINAPLADVWKLFTTPEGYRVLGVNQARIDLRVGGSIQTHAAATGALGDAETRVDEVLAYDPERMLALRVRQLPASFPHRNAASGPWTVIYFTPSGTDMTHVRIVGLGYGDDAASQALREFAAGQQRQWLDQAAKKYWPKCKLCAAEPANTN